MKDFDEIEYRFRTYLFEEIQHRGFGVIHEKDNISFVIDVDEKNYDNFCNLLPDTFEGIPINIRSLKKSTLL